MLVKCPNICLCDQKYKSDQLYLVCTWIVYSMWYVVNECQTSPQLCIISNAHVILHVSHLIIQEAATHLTRGSQYDSGQFVPTAQSKETAYKWEQEDTRSSSERTPRLLKH